jgi:hypothetical protein
MQRLWRYIQLDACLYIEMQASMSRYSGVIST